ncbi:hypothetical protein [Bosea sp. LC85]|uniref:hypothetical protein n=1 Tax=Bosea sp. LC85 TaxID=1502851 RepID=UPI0005BAAC5C|nr:hypothetical protein [Bosea sp. LC85]
MTSAAHLTSIHSATPVAPATPGAPATPVDSATPGAALTPPELLRREIQRAGSEARLATAAGCSQVAINKAKRAASVSPWMALRLEAATGVPRQHWRPDLWPGNGVPGETPEQALPERAAPWPPQPARIARFRKPVCVTQLAFPLDRRHP